MEVEQENIEGIVTPSSWDQKGNVLTVHIALGGEINVEIGPRQAIVELGKYVGAVVRLVGKRSASKFMVENYEILKLYRKGIYEKN